MGGAITIIFRTEEGWFSKLHWTNSYNWIFCNMKLINKDPDFIQEQIDRPHWLYEDDPSYEHPFAPCEYGIIVCDFVENRILAASNYSTVCEMSPTWVTCPDGCITIGGPEKERAPQSEEATGLWEADRIQGLIVRVPMDNTWVRQLLPVKDDATLDQFANTIDEMNKAYFSHEARMDSENPNPYPEKISIDMSPFAVGINTDKNIKALEQIRAYMIERGCPQNQADLDAWEEELNWFKEVEE